MKKKPVTPPAEDPVLARIDALLSRPRHMFLQGSVETGLVQVPIHTISFIRSESHGRLTVGVGSEVYHLMQPLSEVESRVTEAHPPFFHCDADTLVNLDHVTRLTREGSGFTLHLLAGTRATVGPEFVPALKERVLGLS